MTNELSNSKIKRKRRAWTEERRKAQAERAKSQKPWLHATGPQTGAGKTASARNAYKHGFRSEDLKEIRQLLRYLRDRTAALTAGHTGQNHRYSPE